MAGAQTDDGAESAARQGAVKDPRYTRSIKFDDDVRDGVELYRRGRGAGGSGKDMDFQAALMEAARVGLKTLAMKGGVDGLTAPRQGQGNGQGQSSTSRDELRRVEGRLAAIEDRANGLEIDLAVAVRIVSMIAGCIPDADYRGRDVARERGIAAGFRERVMARRDGVASDGAA